MKTLNVNNYDVKIYQAGEVQITIPKKDANRLLANGDLKVYLTIGELRALLELANKSYDDATEDELNY